ncbi:arginine utilization regulatory protein [Bacillus pakistanensis]|uniref:Arginine utilization regulatory protein n=1 Tax=Rossellomorea pakistanensis TaxID=992288 RepID=A0ABS2NEM8_9BACI|nr:sigma 54-interacting transcriptional regulator [Bacillus pakistanensis]MBM7586268.1 arginine utilization regulatory protein [Bacillus pakistanensis]
MQINQNHEKILLIYEKTINAIDAGVHVIDQEGRTIIYNQKMMEIEGMEVDDVLDKNLLEVFQFEKDEESTLLKVLTTGESRLNVKQTYFNINGHEITTINDTFPIIIENNIVGAMEIARDVTKLEKLIRENRFKKEDTLYTFDNIIGNDPVFQEAIETSKRATRTTSSVLIIGETGTGKELFAQSIHNDSPRSSKPFVSQNCAALPDTLIEGILFGTKKGAFTGSIERPGLFEQAEGGTLLLDEINSLDPSLQAKLLRVIQEKKVRRIGDTIDRPIDVRIIATINEDPIDAISENRLRKDLYYRLSVVSIFIPPLKARQDDIQELTAFFIEKYNSLFGMNIKTLDSQVKKLFLEYDWPGNVRELEHVIEGAFNLMEYEEVIEYNHLPIQFRQKSHPEIDANVEDLLYQTEKEIKPLDEFMYEAETYYIQKALIHHHFNITKTAKSLGMSRQNLQYRIRKYGIEKPD